MLKKHNTVEQLKQKDIEIGSSPSQLGKDMLGFSQCNNAMRSVMYSSHLNQFTNLLYSQFPKVFTGFENTVGEYSDGYHRSKHNYTVVARFGKFEDIIGDPTVATVIVYDKDNDVYDAFVRKPIEDLTESYAYEYNNAMVDRLKPGDVIKNGDILYRSKSYDEHMNYSFGLNVTTMWSTDPDTSEDAAKISARLAKRAVSVRGESVLIGVNDNDYGLNLYGTDGEYKIFPDVGEFSNGTVMATRRLYGDQVLFDFRDDVLRESIDGDTEYFLNGMVYDVKIYCNNEDLKDTPFNRQIIKYLESQNRYYQDILDVCEEIKRSGKKFTKKLDHIYKEARDFLNTDYDWRNGENSFSNIMIEIFTSEYAQLAVGTKLTGRHGNKSVIAKIIPDHLMPFTEDGRQVDLIVNILAVINRTIAGPIFEESINFCSSMAIAHMKTLPTTKKKADFLHEFIGIFNRTEEAKFRKIYQNMSSTEKTEYIKGIEGEGIFINIMPVGDPEPIFYKLLNAYNKYDWLKPQAVYIQKFGRKIKTLQPQFIGEMYVLILKQTSKKGFSVRGMGAINNRGLPERSYKNKSHMEQHSTSSIRFGESETLNFLIGTSPEELALFHAYYRTSLNARKDLGKSILLPNGRAHVKKKYISRIGEVYAVILKSLGFSMEVVDDENVLDEVDDRFLTEHTYGDMTYLCSDYQSFLKERVDAVGEELMRENPVIDRDELRLKIDERMINSGYVVSTSQYKDAIGDFAENNAMYDDLMKLKDDPDYEPPSPTYEFLPSSLIAEE